MSIFDMSAEAVNDYIADVEADEQAFYEAFAQACDAAFDEGREAIECAPTLRSHQL